MPSRCQHMRRGVTAVTRSCAMGTDLHELRLDMVLENALASGAESVLDLGCGHGELLVRLACERQFTRIVGIDISTQALAAARVLLALDPSQAVGRIELLHASFTEPDDRLTGFDLALMVETIEHVDPGRLSLVERAVFAAFRPSVVIVTTPNQEYNVLHGLTPGVFRHPDHRFEWNRVRFRRWSDGVAQRNGYAVRFSDIGDHDSALGASTQMARFQRIVA
jgi:small RNA 2'-O-methyltransferase